MLTHPGFSATPTNVSSHSYLILASIGRSYACTMAHSNRVPCTLLVVVAHALQVEHAISLHDYQVGYLRRSTHELCLLIKDI
jgi:hypothetical protein